MKINILLISFGVDAYLLKKNITKCASMFVCL